MSRFGTPYHDGYGINCETLSLYLRLRYNVANRLSSIINADLSGRDLIKFGIESKFTCTETSTALFQRVIVGALREMRELCSPGPEPVHRDTPTIARL
jgi:carnitine O-acetyltransferase